MPPRKHDASTAARELAALFPRIYLAFHRRAEPEADRMTPQSLGLLQHLTHAGPLTIGELALHLGRAQSVISETVDALEVRGLLARMRDERDRRRTLVWLTDAAHAWLARQREVLDPDRLALAMAALEPDAREGIISGLEALLRAAEAPEYRARASVKRHGEEKKR